MKYKDLKSRNVAGENRIRACGELRARIGRPAHHAPCAVLAGLNNFVCILEKIAQDHSLSAAISRHAPRPAPREALRQGDINIRHDMGAFAKPSGAGPRHDRCDARCTGSPITALQLHHTR